jgi:hypothetical protein
MIGYKVGMDHSCEKKTSASVQLRQILIPPDRRAEMMNLPTL